MTEGRHTARTHATAAVSRGASRPTRPGIGDPLAAVVVTAFGSVLMLFALVAALVARAAGAPWQRDEPVGDG